MIYFDINLKTQGHVLDHPGHLSFLTMLGLYIYTLEFGHKSCNMLSILNKLALQKELHNCVTNNVFLDKNHINNKTKNQTLKPLPETGIETGTCCTQSECVTTAPPSQLIVSNAVAKGRNINKQNEFAGHTFLTTYFFL